MSFLGDLFGGTKGTSVSVVNLSEWNFVYVIADFEIWNVFVPVCGNALQHGNNVNWVLR
jgi:hypothetical protein